MFGRNEESEAVARSNNDEDYRESAGQVSRDMNRVVASFAELPDVVDDEDSYLGEQARIAEESGRRRPIRARGPRRGMRRGRGERDGSAPTRGRARNGAE
jgi:hypothetical protein